jgi:hypothetical protein
MTEKNRRPCFLFYFLQDKQNGCLQFISKKDIINLVTLGQVRDHVFSLVTVAAAKREKKMILS